MSARCPSCHATVPAGETICLDCGTELVFVAPGDEAGDLSAVAAPEVAVAAPPVAEAPAAEPAEPVAKATPCPDCAERVTPDANGLCPICGHDFATPVTIDENEFFRAPPSLDEALEAERQRAARLAGFGTDSTTPGAGASPSPAREFGAGAPPTPAASTPDHGFERTPSATFGAGGSGAEGAPLPSERTRHRYRGEPGEAPLAEGQAWLFVEGGQSVFFEGRMTQRVRLDVDQLLVGRRDPPAGHYPDIDLAHFRHIDGHISRRHARIYRELGQWRVEDLCDNDATFLNDPSHVLNRDSAPLTDGDRVMISDSVILTFRLAR